MEPGTPGPAVTVRAPAKINLGLAVGPVRDDGYHDLVTLFDAVNLVEEVTVSRTDGEPGTTTCSVQGSHADRVPTDASNLAVRGVEAVRAVARERGLPDADAALAVHIAKDVPVAGGMAGGSADAAAALLATDQLLGLGLTRDELAGLGAGLGADVPFGLVGHYAVGRGRGDLLAPALASDTELHWVLAIAKEGLSTPAVFAECDRLRGDADVPEPTIDEELLAALRSGDARRIGELMSNDLQDAAVSLHPALAETLAVGRAASALGALVSGSGPTIAFLADGHEGALDIAVALAASGVCDDVLRTTGPGQGARVINRVPEADTVA